MNTHNLVEFQSSLAQIPIFQVPCCNDVGSLGLRSHLPQKDHGSLPVGDALANAQPESVDGCWVPNLPCA